MQKLKASPRKINWIESIVLGMFVYYVSSMFSLVVCALIAGIILYLRNIKQMPISIDAFIFIPLPIMVFLPLLMTLAFAFNMTRKSTKRKNSALAKKQK